MNKSRIFLMTDLDGTLEDSRADMTNCVHRARRKLLLPERASDKVSPFVNRGMPELYRNCFDDFIQSSEDYERVRETYERIYFEYIADETRLYDGIKETLTSLKKRGVIFSLITNKPEHLSRELLRKLDVLEIYDAIMGGDSCPETKPSALPLQYAATKFNLDSALDQSFMLGDTPADVQAGKAFGAKTIWCAWGYLKSPDPAVPDFRIQHPRELEEIIFSQL